METADSADTVSSLASRSCALSVDAAPDDSSSLLPSKNKSRTAKISAPAATAAATPGQNHLGQAFCEAPTDATSDFPTAALGADDLATLFSDEAAETGGCFHCGAL